MSGKYRHIRLKKNISVGVFLAGSGAALALAGSGNAYADEMPPQPFPIVDPVPPVEAPVGDSDPSGDVEEAAVAPPPVNVIVETARKQVGTGRTSPFYAQGAHEAWCADFVSWVLKESGVPVGGIGGWRNPSVWGLQSSLQSRGEFRGRNYVPKPGDVVIYGGHHTNLVVDVNGDTITTVGGNEGAPGPNVRTISRHSGSITGFGSTGDNGVRHDTSNEAPPTEDVLTASEMGMDAPPPEALPAPPMEEIPPPPEDAPPPAPWDVPPPPPAPWDVPAPNTEPAPAEWGAPVPPPEELPPPAEELPVPPPEELPAPPAELPPPAEELPAPPVEELPAPPVEELPAPPANPEDQPAP